MPGHGCDAVVENGDRNIGFVEDRIQERVMPVWKKVESPMEQQIGRFSPAW